MKILVVDDEHRIARAVKQGLEQEGYAVDVAYDGEDGYNAAVADEYDAIVLDVMMPEMNGYEVVKKMRDGGNHTPGIAFRPGPGASADADRQRPGARYRRWA